MKKRNLRSVSAPFTLIAFLLAILIVHLSNTSGRTWVADQKNFTYVQGTAPEKEMDPNQIKVTIGSWNICGTHLSKKYGGVVDWKYRLTQILEKVRKMDPDVLCFQEVYDADLSDLLVEGLKDRYAHLFTHLGPNPQNADGGCMILSKYPIYSFRNISFANNPPPAEGPNRGFAILEIKSSKQATAPNLRIVGTHILYGYNDESFAKRKAQVEQLETYLANLPSYPTLIAADFNIEREDPLLAFLEPGYRGQEATCMTTQLLQYWDPSAKGPSKEWIDNISLVKGSRGSIEVFLIEAFNPACPDATTALSDHHLLMGTYKGGHLN